MKINQIDQCTSKIHKSAGNPRVLQKYNLLWKHYFRSCHITCKITYFYNLFCQKHMFFFYFKFQFDLQNFSAGRPESFLEGPRCPDPHKFPVARTILASNFLGGQVSRLVTIPISLSYWIFLDFFSKMGILNNIFSDTFYIKKKLNLMKKKI